MERYELYDEDCKEISEFMKNYEELLCTKGDGADGRGKPEKYVAFDKKLPKHPIIEPTLHQKFNITVEPLTADNLHDYSMPAKDAVAVLKQHWIFLIHCLKVGTMEQVDLETIDGLVLAVAKDFCLFHPKKSDLSQIKLQGYHPVKVMQRIYRGLPSNLWQRLLGPDDNATLYAQGRRGHRVYE